MALIKKIKDGDNTIYPITHADAIWISPTQKLSDLVGKRSGYRDF